MKIDCGDYVYFDRFADNKDKSTYNANEGYDYGYFKQDDFDDLMNDRRYNDAASYLEKFYFKDPAIQAEHENDIANIKRQGMILSAIYSRISDTNPELIKQIDFANSVFNQGGLEEVYNRNKAKDKKYTNQYIDNFYNTRDNVFKLDNGDIADTMEITFYPSKKVDAITGWDFLAADNTLTFDKFLNDSNLTQEDLRNGNVEVINKDGNVTLRFDSTNALANKILYNTPISPTHNALLDVFPFGGDSVPYIKLSKKTDDGSIYSQAISGSNGKSIEEFKSMIREARQTKDEVFKKSDIPTEREYTSVDMPWTTTYIEHKRRAGASDDDIEKARNVEMKKMVIGLHNITIKDEMYSNYDNTDVEVLRSMDGNQDSKKDLIKRLMELDVNDVNPVYKTVNGLVGTQFSFTKSKDDSTRVTLFIPRFWQEEAQAVINRDTSTRAVQTANDMIDYGCNYRLSTGAEIRNKNGQFYKTEQDENGAYTVERPISKDIAVREINKNLNIEELSRQLTYKHINKDFEVYGIDAFEQEAKAGTIKSISELYPNLSLNVDPKTLEASIIDQYGTRYNPDDLFNKTLDYKHMPFDVYDAFDDIYDMYRQIMDQLKYYL